MDSPYSKQFPSLMKGKKIMYVHGFLSSAQSGTVKILQELMPEASVIAEDIPVHPEEAMQMLRRWAACTPRCCTASTAFLSTQPLQWATR